MHKALLDTDIFSEVLKGINPAVAARASAYQTVFGHFFDLADYRIGDSQGLSESKA